MGLREQDLPAWSDGLQADWISVVSELMKAWAVQMHWKSVKAQPVAPMPASAGPCLGESQYYC